MQRRPKSSAWRKPREKFIYRAGEDGDWVVGFMRSLFIGKLCSRPDLIEALSDGRNPEAWAVNCNLYSQGKPAAWVVEIAKDALESAERPAFGMPERLQRKHFA